MLVAGCDPGLDGAIARLAISPVGEICGVSVLDMPTLSLTRGGKAKREVDAHVLADWLASPRPDHVYVEQVGPMPGQGVSGVFAFGKSYGTILGILAALDLRFTLVTPQRWKRALGVPASKDGARARASQLLPATAHNWTRAKDHGRAEATLIAYWGLQSPEKVAA